MLHQPYRRLPSLRLPFMSLGLPIVSLGLVIYLAAGLGQPERAAAQDARDDSKPAARRPASPDRNGASEDAEAQVTARQGTPVLGVVIGKELQDDTVRVTHVWPGSPAEAAGLKAGDEILRIDDKPVNSPGAVRGTILQKRPGSKVTLEVRRDGESRTLDVKLGGADGMAGWIRRGATARSTRAPGWLGLRVSPGVSSGERGVIVERVIPGSPAEQAGLKPEDAILRVGKTRVEAAADLQALIAGKRPGQTVTLVVARDGERQEIKATVGSFARWRGDVTDLTGTEMQELLRELLTAPFELAEEILPEDGQLIDTRDRDVPLPKLAVAQLMPTQGNDVRGTVVLEQKENGLHLSGEIRGLQPGLHGFHIHEYGDLRGPAGKTAGGHFNPDNTPHGGPGDEEHHAGDLGNIEANQEGVARVNITAPWLKLHFIIGRALVVHAGKDDLESQPSGDAGARVALGVIGIGNPESGQ